MIAFSGRVGVLDPVGSDRTAVKVRLMALGLPDPPGLLIELLSVGAGGEFPYVLSEGPARGRSFDHVMTPVELREMEEHRGGQRLVVFAEGGGGDRLCVAEDGTVYGELVNRSGSAARSLHEFARSLEEFIEQLVPDDGVLDDMIEFADEDGFPDRPREIAQLRARWSTESTELGQA